MRHPETMGEAEVTAFLNYLAVERHVAAATQNQALSARRPTVLTVHEELRVKDVDFGYRQILVRDGKGRRIGSRCCRSRCWGR